MRNKLLLHFVPKIVLLLFVVNPAFADESRSVFVSLLPQMDIPLTRDANLFRIGAGVSASGKYAIAAIPWFAVGGEAAFHLGGMEHEDIKNLGTLSLFSAEAMAQLRFLIRNVDIRLSGGAGQFYAFMNNKPSSSAANFVWHGRMGVGLQRTPDLTMGIQAEYRSYHNLYHVLGLGLYFEFWRFTF